MYLSVLTKNFFERPTLKVAKDLLGKFLTIKHSVSNNRHRVLRFMITEVEAYDGHLDKASHAHRGETARNAPMFGPAGVWYVYFVYGMHNMLNIVTGPKDYPAAVLIRGIEGINGPGKFTKFLKIDKKFNKKPATRATGLWIESASRRMGVKIKKSQIKTSPRIGVNYAGECKDKHYRFYI